MARDRAKEAALVASMAKGDSGAALSEFYELYSGIAMALLLRILPTRAEAEELLQDVFVELWRRAPQYDPMRASVSTWVTTVARSRALDALRARKRRYRDQQVPTEDVSLPAPRADQPDELAAKSQRSEAVHRAMENLNAEQREALDYAYFRGLSHSEIASELQIPVGTVKSRILSAMKVLRAAMKTAKEAVG
jgi:RNA polymerase sigma-70 factor (ECF subfamily)